MDETRDGRDIDLAHEPRVTIWNEHRHEKNDEHVAEIYPEGIHATLAGVMLAFTIPMERTPGRSDADCVSPLHRLEQLLHTPVGFLIVPIFGLTNAAVPVLGLCVG